ncbi:MAG: VWA domain-containing protein [Phycisphaerales bacterium]|nr:MAG: VWA domain-containing protein [Phycisphaerales bacterium]
MRNATLEVRTHRVEASIVDGVTVTNVDQVFFNPYDRTVEGTYIFPLEDDIALSKFSMFVNGKEIEGKLLGVEEARRTYESIVRQMRDPALLEYIGTRMFQARIFPINPKSEVRVRLSYTQMLETENGLAHYRYPLNTKRHSATPVGNVSVSVNVTSSVPIKSVFSPSHKIGVSRPSDYRVAASFEDKHVYSNKDFELYYSLGDKEFGLTVLTHRQAGEDGFFLARIAPPANLDAADVMPKDITFVVDTSGSMAGQKINQAKKALQFCLDNLNKEDRFNIVPFSHEAMAFRNKLVEVTRDNVAEAGRFVEELGAAGGTNINDALLAALQANPAPEAARPYMIVFLTDGMPTIGVTDTTEILKNVRVENSEQIRLFVFGVGHDVNTHLLDLLAEQNDGTRDYVDPDEDLELKLSSFYRKVEHPVLAGLALSYGGLKVLDMYPPKLGDLFSGSELVVVGRYGGAGSYAVELTGTRRGKYERFVYETSFPSESQPHEFLQRLWATRKVGYLLDEMRLHGENRELKDTIVQLATRYGIVTPYTAYLVTEPGEITRRGGRRDNWLADTVAASPALHRSAKKRRETRRSRSASSSDQSRLQPSFGPVAVEESKEADALKRLGRDGSLPYADSASGGRGNSASERATVSRVGTRTFYHVGDRWIDSTYDGKTETRKVELFSQAYFDLIRQDSRLGKCFALGERVIVVVNGTVYEATPPADLE